MALEDKHSSSDLPGVGTIATPQADASQEGSTTDGLTLEQVMSHPLFRRIQGERDAFEFQLSRGKSMIESLTKLNTDLRNRLVSLEAQNLGDSVEARDLVAKIKESDERLVTAELKLADAEAKENMASEKQRLVDAADFSRITGCPYDELVKCGSYAEMQRTAELWKKAQAAGGGKAQTMPQTQTTGAAEKGGKAKVSAQIPYDSGVNTTAGGARRISLEEYRRIPPLEAERLEKEGKIKLW